MLVGIAGYDDLKLFFLRLMPSTNRQKQTRALNRASRLFDLGGRLFRNQPAVPSGCCGINVFFKFGMDAREEAREKHASRLFELEGRLFEIEGRLFKIAQARHVFTVGITKFLNGTCRCLLHIFSKPSFQLFSTKPNILLKL